MDISRIEQSKQTTCKGLFWRADVNSFISAYNEIIVTKSLRPLKRKSCPGCQECSWVFDYLSEMLEDQYDILANIIPGKIYTVSVKTSQGYYGLYPEVDEITFVKVNE